MDVILIACPNSRKVVLAGRVLIYAEDASDPRACNDAYDAEWIAEQLARAAGVGVWVHRVDLPAGFAVCDEDGPLPAFTAEDVRDWWVGLCDAQAAEAAMAAPPPSYPTLQEQLLGVVGYAGLDVTDEVRRLAAELERAALEGGCDRD